MKRFLLPCLILLLGCAEEPPGKAAVSLKGIFDGRKKHSIANDTAANSIAPGSVTSLKEQEEFLQVFSIIDPGDFHVSSYHDYSYKSESYRTFKGTPLNPKHRNFFIAAGLAENGQLYACQRFNVDDSTVSIIIRHPGKSGTSSMSMCLWDKRDRKFLPYVFLLSENDEEHLERKDTRILRRGHGRVYLLTHYVRCTEESVPVNESYVLYAISERKFVKWKKKPADL